MTRTQTRELAMRMIYTLAENKKTVDELIEDMLQEDYYATLVTEDELYKRAPNAEDKEYLTTLVSGVAEHMPELDEYIDKHAVGWQFHRISRTAVTIMRLAMYEALYMPTIDVAVSMNEAIELAKKYDTPETVSFTNGVLGAFTKEELPN